MSVISDKEYESLLEDRDFWKRKLEEANDSKAELKERIRELEAQRDGALDSLNDEHSRIIKAQEILEHPRDWAVNALHLRNHFCDCTVCDHVKRALEALEGK